MITDTNLPLVTVGIPTYNRPKGLERTLQCILNQTYANLEIIISDNCSAPNHCKNVDVRAGSPTFLQWFGAELSAENKRMMYVPAGFAHGFQSLTDYAEITYMVSEFYNKESEGGIKFDDTRINIGWPLPVSLVSDKDMKIPLIDETFTGVIL